MSIFFFPLSTFLMRYRPVELISQRATAMPAAFLYDVTQSISAEILLRKEFFICVNPGNASLHLAAPSRCPLIKCFSPLLIKNSKRLLNVDKTFFSRTFLRALPNHDQFST